MFSTQIMNLNLLKTLNLVFNDLITFTRNLYQTNWDDNQSFILWRLRGEKHRTVRSTMLNKWPIVFAFLSGYKICFWKRKLNVQKSMNVCQRGSRQNYLTFAIFPTLLFSHCTVSTTFTLKILWPCPFTCDDVVSCSMGSVKSLLEEKIPGVYVLSLMIGK